MTKYLSLRSKFRGNIRNYKILLDDCWQDVESIHVQFLNEVHIRNGNHGSALLVQNRSRRTLDLSNRCFILVVEHCEGLDFRFENRRYEIDSLEEINDDFIDQSASEVSTNIISFINNRPYLNRQN